eukprot:TRINITY_DN8952_c0_g1_i2.p1 TRINITY_DN8952_c0_g1~~TRINITY_DN8952_c0_g1_i2.p1  ORF type:complete len:278 (+),score=73.17 TRINITY_DN8952_c0_g1_i2:51-884(+)
MSVDPQIFESVQLWLREIYGPDEIPSFEINPRTLGILHQLSQAHKDRKEKSEINLRLQERSVEEIKAQYSRLEDVLGSIGLLPAYLSQSGLSSVRALSLIAISLEAKSIDLASYYSAINWNHKKSDTLRLQLRQLQEKSHALQEDIKKADDDLHNIESTLRHFKEQSISREQDRVGKEKDVQYLDVKSREYLDRITTLKEALQRSGFQSDLQHSSLMEQSKSIQKQSEALSNQRKQLDSYSALPPDILLARVKIEESRRKVQELDREIGDKIESLDL